MNIEKGSLARQLLPLVPVENIRRSDLWRDTSDPTIRPTKLWERTGDVQVGETGFGCAVKCSYCNQQSLDIAPGEGRQAGYLFPMDAGLAVNTQLYIGNKVDRTLSLDNLFGELEKYPHYDRTGTVILENYNDPGINWPRTLDIMNRLVDEQKHTGPIAFITKMQIPKYAVKGMQDIQEKGGKPIGIVTYSGMPREIEPPDPRARIEGMTRLSEGNIPVILSMRPLVDTINATPKNIRRVLEETKGLPDIITVGGLFIYPDAPGQPGTATQFEKAGYPLPKELTEASYAVAKALPGEIRDRVKNIAQELDIDTPFSDHMSCAITRITTEKYETPTVDRMANWSGAEEPLFEKKCATYCSTQQMDVCAAKSIEPATQVIDIAKTKLAEIGYPELDIIPSATQVGQLLIQDGSLPFEEVISIKQACGWDVINLPSKEAVLYRSKQALVDELGLDLEESFAGTILVGQEWHVFLKGNDLDGVNNELVLKWLRHQNRARIQIMDATELHTPNGQTTITDKLFDKSLGLQTKEEIHDQLTQITYALGTKK